MAAPRLIPQRRTPQRARRRNKAELYELVLILWDAGITSPTLIGLALDIPKSYAFAILTLHNRRKEPRNNPAHILAGLPPWLRQRVEAWRASERERAFSNIQAKPDEST